MVGEGLLHECILHGAMEHILVISRKATGVPHAKLTEIILSDFF